MAFHYHFIYIYMYDNIVSYDCLVRLALEQLFLHYTTENCEVSKVREP